MPKPIIPTDLLDLAAQAIVANPRGTQIETACEVLKAVLPAHERQVRERVIADLEGVLELHDLSDVEVDAVFGIIRGVPRSPAVTKWRCRRCGSSRWVAASLTGPVEYGGRAIKQCVPCGHYSNDPVWGES